MTVVSSIKEFMMSELEPTIFIVDGDGEARNSLRRLLESVRWRTETFATASAFLDRYNSEMPGCLILEVRLRDLSGVELHRRLRRDGSRTPVIFLTQYADVATAVDAMRQGAFHFLQKPVREQYFLDQVQAAVAKDLRERTENARRQAAYARLERLSSRERRILAEILAGRTNKQAACRLGVTVKTIEFHRANIMKKSGVDSLAELIYLVFRSGWEPPKNCG